MTPRDAIERIGGIWRDGRGTGPCPVPGHGRGRGDLNWSLSISAGSQQSMIAHCFAGCDPRDVLAALNARREFPLNATVGEGGPTRFRNRDSFRGAAATMWSLGMPVLGTLAENYLQGRGLWGQPEDLRFLPSTFHRPTRQLVPAMLAALRNPKGDVVAVQRTFLAHDGRKASVGPARMLLGRLGRGAVRLGPAGEVLGLAEGVETALSAAHMFGVSVWAACGTRLACVDLPPCVRRVTIFADHDPPGAMASQAAARRFTDEGIAAEIVRPRRKGWDWNDALLDALGARNEAAD